MVGVSEEQTQLTNIPKVLQLTRIKEQIEYLREVFSGRKVIISVDTISGVSHTILGFEKFLEEHPSWIESVVLLQIVFSTKKNLIMSEKQILTTQINEIVDRINGRFGTLRGAPIQLVVDRKWDFRDVLCVYAIADIALVTSSRDRVNLLSYEYVACQQVEKSGIIILNKFSDTGKSFGAGALCVNPLDIFDISACIGQALNMSAEEREERHKLNFAHITTQDVMELYENAQKRYYMLKKVVVLEDKLQKKLDKLKEVPGVIDIGEWRARRTIPDKKKKLVTVLSIDGGGIRGYIPAIILAKFEEKLREVFGEDARIAHYFDVVTGTSTGALIAMMLTAPDKNKQPMCTAEQIKNFYTAEGPKIFPKQGWGIFGKIVNTIRMFMGPKYDGIHLRNLAKEMFGDLMLSNSLTNVVVPMFDVNAAKEVIFSTYKVAKDPRMDVQLMDISLATTAAPSYFPGHTFTNGFGKFAGIDGGVFANNPISIGVGEAVRDAVINKKEEPDDMEILVLSLGTGSDKTSKEAISYRSQNTSNSGIVGWLFNPVNLESPYFDLTNQVISRWVNVSLENTGVFVETTCVRMQDDKLEPSIASLDDSSKKKMDMLAEVAENLYVFDRNDEKISLLVEIARAKKRLESASKGLEL